MKKRIVCLLLAVIFVLAFAACGGGGTSTKDTTTAASTSEASTQAAQEPAKEINVVFLQGSASLPDLDAVVAEINKSTKEKINTTIKMTGIPVANYAQQIKLMLTSQETMDLFTTGTLPFFDFIAQATNNQLLPLDDLLSKYGQNITEAVGPYLPATKINGKIYAVTNNSDKAVGYVFAIRSDIVEKYKLDFSNVKKLEDLTPVFEQLKAEKDIGIFSPSTAGDNGLDDSIGGNGIDPLGSDYYFTGVLMDPQDITQKVVDYYETPEAAAIFKLVRSWNQAGYIMPGIMANKEGPQELIKAGKLLSYMQAAHPATQSQLNVQCAQPMTLVEVVPALSTTARVTPFLWAIPTYSKVPENAMKFLNLMFSDVDLINLLDWGIEGKHYVKNSDGSISYPEGVDANTVAYPMNMSFMWGNQMKSYIMKGEDMDMWKKMEEFNKTATKSKALGFMFNLDPVKTEYAACLNVYQQYHKALGVGAVDPDKILPEFNSKLKAAGVDKILAEKQKQFDEFVKVNNIK